MKNLHEKKYNLNTHTPKEVNNAFRDKFGMPKKTSLTLEGLKKYYTSK